MTTAKRPNIERLWKRAAIRNLAELLKHEDVIVRLEAAAALSSRRRIGWEPSDDVERTLLAIGGDEWDAVKELGERAVPTLLACFEELGPHPSAGEMTAVLRGLGRQRSWEQSRERMGAMLGEIADSRAVEPLVAILEQGVHPVDTRGGWRLDRGAIQAARALGMIGDPRAAEPLLRQAGNVHLAKECVGALADLLERAATAIPNEILQELARLAASEHVAETGYTWTRPVDCSRVNELARLELAHRNA